MKQLHYITGQAGTGKTHALMESLVKWFQDNSLENHQSVLAITRMHGSRKRLLERLKSKSIDAKLTVCTVDSFGLQLVNRWRLSLGYSKPIVPVALNEQEEPYQDEIGHRLSFEEIMRQAAKLASSPTVAKSIANSHPVILIDEFQDCTDCQLSLISNLKGYVDIILAADPFQSLDGDESACNWIDGFEGDESTQVTRLSHCRRTTCSYILEAASALHENHVASYSRAPLPFYIAPTYNMAVWKLQNNYGPAALIYTANRVFTTLENTASEQNAKKQAEGKRGIKFFWRPQVSISELSKETQDSFAAAINQGTWAENKMWRKLYQQALGLAKARGHVNSQEPYMQFVVNSFIQSRRFVESRPMKFEATTVHGAKNREFDYVYVVWDTNLCSNYSDEQKRRLLYNAITRAKKSCVVVVIGNKKMIKSCPVLSLLGKPLDVFS
jgi:superfamily I DNA/RNA helicase